MRVTASPHVLLILSLCSLWKLLPLITAEVWEWMTLKMILAAKNIQRFALTTGGMDITGADLISSPEFLNLYGTGLTYTEPQLSSYGY